MKIIPAILPLRYHDIINGVEKVVGSVDTVQVDFVDGFFATNRTWWFNNKNETFLESLLHQDEGLPHWEDMNYEFDLMVRDPLEHIDTFIALGPSKIIFHIESMKETKMVPYFQNLPEIVRSTITFGIAIGVDTDPTLVKPYLEYIDTIQCMGIAQVGFQGQPFDSRVIDQVTKVKSLYLDKTIAVDGAVSLDNAAALVQAGATTLVVGSVVFQSPDPHGTIRELKQLCHQASSAQEN